MSFLQFYAQHYLKGLLAQLYLFSHISSEVFFNGDHCKIHDIIVE